MNKKLTKLLSVFLIAGAVGAGAAGIAGCKPTPEHTHDFAYEDAGNGKHHVTCTGCDETFADETHSVGYLTAGNGKHHQACTVCGAVSGEDEPHTGLQDDNVCDDCNAEYVVEEFACDFTNPAVSSYSGSSAKTPSEISLGKFTIGKGVYVEGTSAGLKIAKGDVNTQKQEKSVLFSLNGEFNKNFISFKAKGANAGDIVKLCKSDGTVVKEFTLTASVADYSTGYNFVNNTAGGTTLSAGDYYIGCSAASIRIGDLKVKEYIENAPVVKIEAVPAKTQFKTNDTLDVNGLVVNAEKANGAKVPLNESDYTTNANSIDMSTAGEKTITVTYTANPSITADFTVNVVGVTGVSLNDEFMQKVYIKGATALDTGNLVVYAQLGSATNTEKVASGSYTVDTATYNLNQAGEYDVKVSYNGFNAFVKITVIESAIVAENNQVKVSVDCNHSGLEGAQVSGVMTFTTIGNAIDYLEASNLESSVIKIVEVEAGEYEEKITTALDNLTLIGKGTTRDDTRLTYKVVEAMVNPVSGSVWGLHAATLTVSGVNFKAYNIAIRNDFDYINDHGKYPGGPQGLAIRIAGDRAVLYNCHLFGNQDTLYVYNGRAYLYETQIDGNVDFIFGENKGSAYFEKCVIKGISRNNNKEEGCVTAWKGEGAAINCIFNDCTFIADENCADQSMALGRTWGAKASVAIINSTISAAYSKYAYGAAASGYKSRYQNMNGSPEEASFVEIGNTGDGAISSSIAGVTVGGSADDYTKAVIFAATNGNVTYASAWDCDEELLNLKKLAGLEQGEISKDPNVSVSFNGIAITTDLTTHINGLFTYTGTIAWNDKKGISDGIEIAAGTVIQFEQAGRVAIEWYSNSLYGNPHHVTIEYIEGGICKITALQKTYINGITLNTADVPAKSTAYTITYKYNDGNATPDNTDTTVVEGNYLTKPADPTLDGYSFVAWHVDTADGDVYDFDSPVTGAITLVAEWSAGATEYQVGAVIDISAISQVYQVKTDTTTGMEQGVLLDATADGAKIQKNGDNVIFNSGATIKVKVAEGLTVLPIWHNATTMGSYTVSARDAEGYVTITANAGADTYIMKIMVITAYDPEVGGTIDLTEIKAEINGHYADNGILAIDARNGKFAPQGTYAQVNPNTVFKVKAPAGDNGTRLSSYGVEAYNGTDITSSFTPGFAGGYYTLTQTADALAGGDARFPKSISLEIASANA